MNLRHLTLAAMTLTLGCGGSAVAELRLYDAAPAGVTAVNIWVKSMDVHVTTHPNTATFTDGSTCNLDTSAVAIRGIKINHVFKAFQAKQGETEQVFVHFDLDNSLTATASCFALSPMLELTKVLEHGHSIGIN